MTHVIVYLSRCIIKCDYHIVIIVCTPKILYFCTITGHRVLCISFDWNQYKSKLNIFLLVPVHGQMKLNNFLLVPVHGQMQLNIFLFVPVQGQMKWNKIK